MRAAVRLVSGIASPHQRASLELIPSLGRHVFSWLAELARKDARKLFQQSYSKAKRTHDKNDRKEVTRWYLAERLLDLVESAGSSRESKLPSLSSAVKIERADLWYAVATFATWTVRESDTERFSTIEEATAQKSTRRPARSPRFRRKGLRTAIAAYVAARSSAGKSPESSLHDPMNRLQKELGKSMVAVGATVRSARHSLDRAWAGGIGVEFNLPSPDNVLLLLATLVHLLPEAHVRTSDLDAGLESYLEMVLLELTRAHIGSLSQLPSGIEVLTQAFALNLSLVLSRRLDWEKTSQPVEVVEEQLEQLASDELASRTEAVREIFCGEDAEGAKTEASRLAEEVGNAVVAKLTTLPEFDNLGTAPLAIHLDWRQDDMQALCNAAALRCQQLVPFSLDDVIGDQDRTASVIVRTFLARYTARPAFSVAVPTTMSAVRSPATRLTALSRADLLRTDWGMSPLDELPPSRNAKEARSTLMLHYPAVVAHARTGAVEWARRVSTAEASLLWLILGSKSRVDTLEPIYSRSREGQTYSHLATSRDIVPPSELSGADVNAANKAMESIRIIAASPAGTAMARVTSGATFAHLAAQSEHPHERYLYAWMSLEAIFGRLEHDTEDYERIVPIGTRVAYRCALMLDPPRGYGGRTYGQFRWGITVELQALYKMRNATVHEGQHAPVVNKMLEERWRSLAAVSLSRIMVAVVERGAKTVEEVLAFRENRFPPGTTIA